MTRYLLAHDLGTSGNKATLFSESGQLISSVVASYDTHYFNVNWAEQNPEDWWQAVCESTRQLLSSSAIKPEEIAGVSFSGHMMGCLCVDSDGQPLRPHILWADQRSQAQAQQLMDIIPSERFYSIVGHRCSPSYSLTKLMWVRDNEPEIYAKTYKMIHAKDWLVFKLTGQILSEFSDASGTNALDIQSLTWSEEIIAASGINRDKFPELVASTHIAGGVTAEAAQATGLAVGTPVVMGGGDGLCGTVGAGCIQEGIVHTCLGSSSWVSFTADRPLFDEQQRTFNWVHLVPGMYCPCGTMQTAGSSLSWVKREIAKIETEQAKLEGINPYALIDQLIAEAAPGSNGVVFLPYLLGERAPRWNSDAKGAFIGLKMESKRGDILRSVLEGVAMNLGVIIDIYREYGYPIKDMVLIGGGAKSDPWCQILADVWNSQIRRLNYLEEATSMGAAVAAGVGVGLYKDFSAINQYIDIAKEFTPDPNNVELYVKIKGVFNHLYQVLLPVFPELSALGQQSGK
jgi:xylulokinase